METISQSTLIISGIAAAVIAITLISGFFNKIIFKMSIRNSYRRITTTVLVVIGAMVGTALITGSQVINDSFKKTADQLIKESLGEIDVEIKSDLLAPIDEKGLLVERLKQVKNVDDVQVLNTSTIAIQKITSDNSGFLKGNISLLAADWSEMNQFGADDSFNQKISEPKAGEAYVLEATAKAIDLNVGDQMNIYVDGVPYQFKVVQIKEGKGATGYVNFENSGNVIVSREDFYKMYPNLNGMYNTIFVSHVGGLYPTDYKPEQFQEDLKEVLQQFESPLAPFVINEQKDTLISEVSDNGTSTIFASLSIFGIFAGGLLIINIYLMLAEERKSEMGILRAIAFKRSDLIKAYAYEGLTYSVLSALTGTALGVLVGYLLVSVISIILNQFLSTFGVDASITFGVTVETLIKSFSLGILITYFTVVIASFFVSRVNIVSAIREIPAEPTKDSRFKKIFKWLFVLFTLGDGIFLFASASSIQKNVEESGNDSLIIDGYMWYFGLVFILASSGFIIKWISKKYLSQEKRKLMSWVLITCVSTAIFLYSIYAISAEKFEPSIQSNPGFLLLIGIGLVVSLTLMITYNINIITQAVTFLLKPFKRGIPVVRIALKYPASNQSRTGLTLAMYAIVIFILFFISIYRSSLDVLFEKAENSFLGGYDGLVTLRNSSIEDGEKILRENNEVTEIYSGQSFYATFPEVETEPNPQQSGFTGPIPQSEDYIDRVYLASDKYLDAIDKNKALEIDKTIEGLDKDKVWERLQTDTSAVVITGKYQYNIPYLPKWKVGDQIKFLYPGSDILVTKIIVATLKPDSFGGELPVGSIILTKDAPIQDILSEQVPTAENSILFNFDDNADFGAESKKLKQEFAKRSEFNILIARELTVTIQAFVTQLIYLMQGFLSFGLIVGLAGLAVIMTRSVHERKQQIGMLRSLGFTRRMILSSFILEASLIGILGIFIGVSTGSIAGVQLISTLTEDFKDFKVSYPIDELSLLVLMIYLGTLLFAILPAISASRLEPVEATNYPE